MSLLLHEVQKCGEAKEARGRFFGEVQAMLANQTGLEPFYLGRAGSPVAVEGKQMQLVMEAVAVEGKQMEAASGGDFHNYLEYHP